MYDNQNGNFYGEIRKISITYLFCSVVFYKNDLWKIALYIACIIFLIVKYFAVINGFCVCYRTYSVICCILGTSLFNEYALCYI